MAEMERLLRKVMTKIIADPRIMAGYDISDRELTYIVETKKLPLNVFLHVAGDYAFIFAEAENFGITLKEARQLKEYFEGINLKKEGKYLKKLFPFIESEMGKHGRGSETHAVS